MKKFVIANWKMLPKTPAEAREVLARVDEFLQGYEERMETSLVFCPPFVFLDEVADMLKQSHLLHDAELGAQDIAVKDEGAMTGEISGPQLAASGVRYVIVGHSERRYRMHEDDDTVRMKLEAALRSGLVPVVCLGETSRDRNWHDFIRGQGERAFAGLPPPDVGRCIVAYEPVWAISTEPGARPDVPESAEEAVRVIRSVLRRVSGRDDNAVLYGGSVNPSNAGQFLGAEGIDGVLVGGASVRPDDFIGILHAAATLNPKP